MNITKSESRERYHAEQPTANGAIHGFGDNRQEAVAEVIEKMKCPNCGHTLSCHRCRSAKGAQATNAKLTPEQLSAKMRKAGVASGAKRARNRAPVLRSPGEEPPKVGAQKAPDGASSAS